MKAAICLSLALAGPVGADPLPADVPVAAAPVPDDKYPPRAVVFPGGVTGYPDLTYSVVPGFRPMTLDLYVPPRDGEPGGARRPLLVYLHGGAWIGGHSRQAGALADFPGLLAAVAARGHVVASVNYRLSGEAIFPAAIQDVRTAIRWLRLHGPDYGIDPDRVVVWGSSAGGQLAALLATTCGDPSLDPPGLPPGLQGQSACVSGAVAWYGIFDFATLHPPASADPPPSVDPGSPEARYLGCDPAACAPGRLAAASPIARVDRRDPPMLLIHGTDDRIVPARQSEDMAGALLRAGVAVRLVLIPGVDHSFIGATPADTRAATLRALEETLAFVDEIVGSGRE